MYSETSLFTLAVYLPGKLFLVNGLHKEQSSVIQRSTRYPLKVGLHSFGDKSFYSKRMDNWYFADPILTAQEQKF